MKSCFSSKHFIRWWFITVVVSLQCCKVPQPLAQMASNGQSNFGLGNIFLKWHCHFMTPIPIVQDSKPQACSLRRCIGLTTGMTQPHSWGMLGYDPLSSDTYVPIYIYIKSGMICKIRQPFSYTQTVSCMHHLVIPSSCTPHPSLLRFLLAIFCAHSFNLRLPEGNVVSR